MTPPNTPNPPLKTHASNPTSLSVVIPVYNESDRLDRAVESVSRYAERRGQAWQVIVVDDGSRTPVSIDVAGVALLRHEPNRGKGYAVRQGVRASTGGRVLVTDADMATPIDDLPKLEAALDGGADVAIGSRLVAGARIDSPEPLSRRLGARVFHALRRRVLLADLLDTQCGFKLWRGDVARAVFEKVTIERFLFDVEALALARAAGSMIREVPITWTHDHSSRVRPIRDGLVSFRDLVRVARRVQATTPDCQRRW